MTIREVKQEAVGLFRDRYRSEPEVVGIAPGRVELLGNHTDYNGGFVLSVALDRVIAAAAAPAEGGSIELTSAFFEDIETAEIGRWAKIEKAAWTHYPIGTLKELSEAGAPLGGMKFAYASSVPSGSGLSSSAALLVSTAQAALALCPHEIEKMQLARLCQRAENNFVGLNCGLLDQFSSVFGAENCAMFLDCQTLQHRVIPFQAHDIDIIVANSMTKHSLVEGEYNRLRQACMDAAVRLGELRGKPATLLREISAGEFETHAETLPEDLRRRAQHVIYENQRVLDGVAALERGELETFGQFMFDSHASSRDEFGNSCAELDCLVELAHDLPGVIGAKLSGGGFGGCTVNLVHRDEAEGFIERLADGFYQAMGRRPDIHLCAIGAGAHAEAP